MGGLAEQLYGLYQAEIYTVLSNNDPEYQRSLANAGLGWNVRSIPAEKRSSFEQEMKMRAWMGARRVEEARSLAPGTMRAKVLTGPTKLYRVSQSGSKGPIGIWWFGEQVAQRCRKEAGGVASQQLEWLRNVLAVCFNWSTFDRVEHTSDVVTRTVVSPVRQVSGIVRGVTAGVEFFLGNRGRKDNGDSRTPRRPVPQDEMFI